MTDQTNTASGDLSLPGSQPAPEPLPPLSYAEANDRRVEFMQSAELRDKLMAGDVETTHLWKRIVEGLSAQAAAPASPLAEAAQHLQQTSGDQLNDFQILEIEENHPVTPLIRRKTEALWQDRKSDAQWFARYQRGEMTARKEMALIQSILSRPVRDPESK